MAFRFPRQLLFPLWRGYCSPVQDPAEQLLREICGKIRFQGPMTVAEYMQNVLTHPLSGYYTKVNKENFGVQVRIDVESGSGLVGKQHLYRRATLSPHQRYLKCLASAWPSG